MRAFVFLIVVVCVAGLAALANAQFNPGFFLAGKIAPRAAPPTPLPQPLTISPAGGQIADTAASGQLVAGPAVVTMSHNGTFASPPGSCTLVDTDTTGPGPGGTFVKANGCNIVTSGPYNSGYDGTYPAAGKSITWCASENGGQACTPFLLTIGSMAAPAAALAGCNQYGTSDGSCFNTLARNYDFTGQTAFGSQPANFYQTFSNWFTCSNSYSTTYQMVMNGPNQPQPGNWACPGDLSIVSDNDGGTNFNVLVLTYTPTDSSNGAAGVGIAEGTQVGSAPPALQNALPEAGYIEWRARVSPNYSTYCPSCQFIENIWRYATQGNGPGCTELDFLENDLNTNDYSGENECGYLPGGPVNGWPSGYDRTTYHTFGLRFTTSTTGGSGGVPAWDRCLYFDGTQLGCDQHNYAFAGNTESRSNLVIWGVGFNSAVITGNISLYMEYERVWECSTWATNSCTGHLITSNP